MMETGRAQLYNSSILDAKVNNSVRGTKGDEAKLRQAAKDFQTLFVKQMLDSMKKTVNKNGLLDGGMGERIFEDMLYDKYADNISSSAGLGIDDMIYKQLSTKRPEI